MSLVNEKLDHYEPLLSAISIVVCLYEQEFNSIVNVLAVIR